jgi:hypothetical protein
MNLAVVECGLGERAVSLAILDRLLEFAPDNQKAKALALRIRAGSQECGAH